MKYILNFMGNEKFYVHVSPGDRFSDDVEAIGSLLGNTHEWDRVRHDIQHECYQLKNDSDCAPGCLPAIHIHKFGKILESDERNAILNQVVDISLGD